MTPLAEILAAVQTLRERPSLVLAQTALAAPLIDWLGRRAAYASAYTKAAHQEVAAGAAALRFARDVNAITATTPATVPGIAQEVSR